MLLIITAVFARLLSPDSAERAGKDHQEVWLKESKIPPRDPDSEIQGWDLQSILKFFFPDESNVQLGLESSVSGVIAQSWIFYLLD